MQKLSQEFSEIRQLGIESVSRHEPWLDTVFKRAPSSNGAAFLLAFNDEYKSRVLDMYPDCESIFKMVRELPHLAKDKSEVDFARVPVTVQDELKMKIGQLPPKHLRVLEAALYPSNLVVLFAKPGSELITPSMISKQLSTQAIYMPLHQRVAMAMTYIHVYWHNMPDRRRATLPTNYNIQGS